MAASVNIEMNAEWWAKPMGVWCALVATSFAFAETPAGKPSDLGHAKVYSIEVGVSTIKDLSRSVGRPKQQIDNENNVIRGVLGYQYDVTWPATGQLWAYAEARTYRITLLIYKSKVARMPDLEKAFGSRGKPVRYRRKSCDDPEKQWTLCADTAGPVTTYQYPEQGIVVFPGPDGTVNDVYFLSSGLELLDCDCTPQK